MTTTTDQTQPKAKPYVSRILRTPLTENSSMKEKLILELRMDDLHDGWGVCMSWLFAVAEYTEHDLQTANPPKWEYRAGAFGPALDSGEYYALAELKPNVQDIEEFGEFLWRWRSLLKAAHLDY